MPGFEFPAIPPAEWLAQSLGLSTTAKEATEEVDVLIMYVERHLLQHQVAPQGWTPGEQPASRPERNKIETGEHKRTGTRVVAEHKEVQQVAWERWEQPGTPRLSWHRRDQRFGVGPGRAR